ncbi:unnamed protein product [Orchesella dallaii]|uniref:Uncharacterized protein n=1 Tax=Orchesella dallaii TaxID=48710 RepID=A0ABP1RTW4_9HEXA
MCESKVECSTYTQNNFPVTESCSIREFLTCVKSTCFTLNENQFEILNFFKRNLKSIKSEVDSCFNQVIGQRNSDANINSRIKINADSETNANEEINARASANGKGYFGADENVVEAKMSSSKKRNTVGNADSRSSYEKLEEARRAYFSHSEVNKKYVDE